MGSAFFLSKNLEPTSNTLTSTTESLVLSYREYLEQDSTFT